MNLNLDHIVKSFNHLVHLVLNDKIYQPYLIISHIFENSKISQYNTLPVGSIINKVNDKKVRTLKEYRELCNKKNTGAFLWFFKSSGLCRTF